MAKTDYQSVDEYLAAQPAHVRVVLERVRAAIRKAVPGAEETISYQIPAYKIGGRVALYFAGWKEHVSLYPVGPELLAAFGDEIAPYVASKGTLRFPLAQALPVRLIGRVAKFRATETLTKRASSPAKKSPPQATAGARAKPAAKARPKPPARARRT